MAKAAMAREQETLEKAKRQAQRSKRVAGFIIDPKKLEEQKRQREREAIVKLKDALKRGESRRIKRRTSRRRSQTKHAEDEQEGEDEQEALRF